MARQLTALRRRASRDAESSLADPQALLGIAISARMSENPARAERFARRVLQLDPDNATAAAILSSIWRAKGKPKAALALADRFQGAGDPYILTSRAAALADLGRWEEALAQVRQVFVLEKALQGGPSEESLAVFGRVRSNAPQLISEVREDEAAYLVKTPSPLAEEGWGEGEFPAP